MKTTTYLLANLLATVSLSLALVLPLGANAASKVALPTNGHQLSIEAGDDEPKGIRFEHLSFEEVKAIAKRENKIIFIDAFTTWCGPCKQMDKQVFTDPIVAKFFNDRFINAKFDMEKGEGLELASKYEVRAYPTFLFLAADGELVHRGVGSRTPAKFVMLGQAALEPADRITTWQKRFKEGERDTAFVKDYFGRLDDAGLSGAKEFKAFLDTQSLDALATPAIWNLYTTYGNLKMQRELDWVLANRAKITTQVPNAQLDEVIVNMYAQPIFRAYAMDAKGAEYSRLTTALRAAKVKGADELIALAPVVNLEAGEDPANYAKEAITFFNKFPNTQRANLLNSIAWGFYGHVDSPKSLAVATKMIKQAMKVSPGNYAYEDTHASILFKRKLYKEALEAASKAIETGLANGEDVSGTQELIGKIKAVVGSKEGIGVKKKS